MKKGLGKFIVYVAAVVITVLGIMIANNLLDRENVMDRISDWPDLQVYTLDGQPVSTATIPGDKPVMLYYFNTECIFCQGTFTDLPNHTELMEEAALVFISDEDSVAVNNFIIEMGLEDVTNILIYYDADQNVKEYFAIRGVPAIYLYNQDRELIELYRGATALTEIRSELQGVISSN